jgi:RNA polymerase primary sigma factor
MVVVHGTQPFRTHHENDVHAYLKDIDGTNPLTREEEADLAARIRAGDRKAKERLVRANLKFVVSVCAHYRNRGVPLADLIGEGNLGLIRAAERFDGTLDNRFISYAVWWVRQAVLAALAAQGRLFPLSSHKAGLVGRVERAAARLSQKLGRPAETPEIAREAGVPEEEVISCRGLTLKAVPLDGPAGEGEGRSPEESLAAEETESPEEDAGRAFLRRAMEPLLQGLNARDREIVRRYHGLGYETSYTMGELGRRFGLNRRSVAFVLRKSMERLRRAAEIRGRDASARLREAARMGLR